MFSTGLPLYKTLPCTLPVPGAGLTFSTPVSVPPFAAGDDAPPGRLAEAVPPAPFVEGEFLLHPASEIAAAAQAQAISRLLSFMV
jgi:hypothetical protein